MPAPKDGAADKPDNEPNIDPVDDEKSEHGDGSGENAMPKKKEDQESEDGVGRSVENA